MDYAQMELLRQQRVLTVLLTGGELPEYGENGQAWERAGMENAGRQVLTGGAHVWSGAGEEISPSLQKNVSNDMRGTPAERQAAGNTGAVAGTVLRAEDRRRLEREAFSGGVHGTFEAMRRKQPGSTGTVDVWPLRDTVFWEGSGQQNACADVQAISRAFQQDARRYDGGFPLY